MAELIIDDLRLGYIDMLEFIETEGEIVSPRGMKTREVRNATIVLTDPVKAIPMGIGRKLNSKIGAVETTQLIAGVSSAIQINLASNNAFESYMNNGRLLGAYGPRLYSQIPNVISSISRDPDTRQAAALVWRGDEVGLALQGNKDVPCTVALSWNVRNGKLNATTVMRSNDGWKGVAYDFWMFTRLQLTLAWALGLEVGDYRHHAISLHLYEDDWGKVDELEVDDREPVYPLGFTDGVDVPQSLTEEEALARWNAARSAALQVVRGETPELSNAGWYAEKLGPHAATGELCKLCRYFYHPNVRDEAALHLSADCVSVNA